MRIIDISGEIKTGMWSYDEPFPKFTLKPLPDVPWAGCKVYCDIFDGMGSQTGTYLETPAHVFGDKSYPLSAVPIDKLKDMPCRLIMLPEGAFKGPKQTPITLDILKEALNDGHGPILPGDAVLIGTGWGRRWDEPDFLDACPYFTLKAMNYIIAQKPFLLGSDSPRWECAEKPQGIFGPFYSADILMLAPCVNLEKAGSGRFRLTALPVRVAKTCCAPCRAILCSDD